MNRSYLNLLIAVVLVGALATGCSKDDNSIPVRGNIYYNDTTYKFTQAFFVDFGVQESNDTTYDFDFMMLSSEIKVTKDTAIGIGNFIYFSLESRNKLSPCPGIYKFGRLSQDNGIQNIVYGVFYDSLNFQTDSSVLSDTITSGTVVFTTNGSGIIATIDCKTILGKKLSGSFAGDVSFLDETSKKKKK
ncbi:hypothetical protein [Williamwhitmania taraxaci]|uniref:Lipoprotein n=1 Tax=Williamwhitmania taraxaci TaxID=1640674 RepID=A0A1G6KAU4_9BACT|nr:hypothetical protein [Williamwhitmania taraxaci]SDC28182.1 hypothetical protein SAMN05216323_102412 [Williamwhitmania taraxaci]